LNLISSAEAREILSRRLGPDRVARETEAVGDIIERCGRLPLALALVAARAAMNPSFTLAVIADELRATADRLDVLQAPGLGTDLRAVFSWSYRALTPAGAHQLRLVALHPGPDIALPAVASLAGGSVRQARALTAELTHASLLTEPVAGRFLLHDLLRLYVAEIADTIDGPQEQAAAHDRILDHYLHSARAAAQMYSTTLIPVELPAPTAGVTPETAADRQEALAWFTNEHPVLREIIRRAASDGHHRHTWQLVWSLEYFLDRLGHWEEAAAFARMAVDSATALDDPIARAHAHHSCGRVFNLLRNNDGARTQLQLALDLFTQINHVDGQASVLHYIGFVAERLGELEEALNHSTRALGIYQAMGNRLGQAMALNSIGNLKSLLGDPVGALPHCRQALRLFQELDDSHGEGAAWDSLGYTMYQQGLHEEAIEYYSNALELFREEGARHFEAVILNHLGDAWQASGSQDAARRAWQDAIAVYAEFDRPAAEQVRTKLATQYHPRASSKPMTA
jgi:tetratricopeptide (TPR) repeat protein